MSCCNFIFLTLRFWVFYHVRHFLKKRWDPANFHVLYKVLCVHPQPLFSADSPCLQYMVAKLFSCAFHSTRCGFPQSRWSVTTSPTRSPDQRLISGGSSQYGTIQYVWTVQRSKTSRASLCTPDASHIAAAPSMYRELAAPLRHSQWNIAETCSEGNKKSNSPAVVSSSFLNPVLHRLKWHKLF